MNPQKVFKLRRCMLTLAGASLVCFLSIASTHRPALPELPAPSQRISDFTFDLLQQWMGGNSPPSNLICSPQSIYHGLAISYLGSDGTTKEEIAQLLHYSGEDQLFMDEWIPYCEQLDSLSHHRNIELNFANSLWLDSSFTDFRQEYIQNIEHVVGASINNIDFSQSLRAANQINRWISEATQGQIHDVVSEDQFHSRSRPGIYDEPGMLSINAVYFRSDWLSRFDPELIRPEVFHVDDSTTVLTPMMRQRSTLSYARNEQYQFLELPYADHICSMFILLPHSGDSIQALIQDLDTDKLFTLQRYAYPCEVDLLLPRFTINSKMHLDDDLASMGMKSAFDRDHADFSRMFNKNTPVDRLYISDLHHDALIEVHEDGTRAAAVTRTMHFSFGCSIPEGSILRNFYVNQPFLFFIVHNESQLVLFVGWVTDPTLLKSR